MLVATALALVGATRVADAGGASARAAFRGTNGAIAFSSYGTIRIVRQDGRGLWTLVTDKNGNHDPAWSPDGRWVAFATDRGNESSLDSIWVISADGSKRERVTTQPSRPCPGDPSIRCSVGPSIEDREPAWSPDGRRIIFSRHTSSHEFPFEETTDLYVVNVNGTGLRRVTTTSGAEERRPQWSPNGKTILFDNGGSIYLADEAGGDIRKLTPGRNGTWSPDGRRIAFVGGPGIDIDWIWIVGADGRGLKRISPPGVLAEGLAWSPDGRRIAFERDFHAGAGIWTIGVDGKRLRLVVADRGAAEPDWQPLPTRRG